MVHSMSQKIKNKLRTTEAQNRIEELKEELKLYINANDFKNVPPKVGYLEETRYPLFSTYNMSYNAINLIPSMLVSDAAGREICYSLCSDGKVESKLKIFRSYRYNSSETFLFENTDIRPKYLAATQYVDTIYGLGSEYIVYNVTNGVSSAKHLVFTNGSGYEKWENYKDITSIMAGKVIHQVLYFANENTIGLFTAPGISRILELYDATTLTLINSIELFNGVFDYSAYQAVVSNGNRYTGTLLYNKKTSQLVLIMPYFAEVKYSSGTNAYTQTNVVQIFDIDSQFLRTGVGKLEPKFTQDQYEWLSPTTSCTAFVAGVKSVYDEYEQVVRVSYKSQDSYMETMKKFDASLVASTSRYGIDGFLINMTYTTPDACPWSKKVLKPVTLMNENLYFFAYGSKNGLSSICSEYYPELDANEYLKLKPGKWFTRAEAGEDSRFNTGGYNCIQCQRTGENTSIRQYVAYNSKVYNISYEPFIKNNVSVMGKRILTETDIFIPSFPINNSYILCSSIAYSNNTNKSYCIVSVPKDDFYDIIILEYDFATATWKEHHIIPDVCKPLMTYQKDKYNAINAYAISNVFIDLDEKIYFAINYNVIGGASCAVMQYDPVTNTVTNKPSLGAYYGSKTIGYDSKFGYFTCRQDGGFQYSQLFHSKSLDGVSVDKTLDEVLTGTSYSFKVGLSSAVGLVAYTQATPMLVNGKCKTIGSQGLTLFPSADNYIFVIGKDDLFQLTVRTSPNLLPGENAFNTVLIAKITTNESDPIATEYYTIS